MLVDKLRQGSMEGSLMWDAADKIEYLERQVKRYRDALEVISGSSDGLQALQAKSALDNIGPPT